MFYVCCPSKTDDNVAPKGKENLFLLMPLAIGINDEESIREKYLTEMLSGPKSTQARVDLQSKIEYKRSYCVSDLWRITMRMVAMLMDWQIRLIKRRF